MKRISDVDLKQACRAFAVANTPLFLLRKLRRDPSISEISKSFSEEEILSQLRKTVSSPPETVLEHVIPYAYLVALALKPSDQGLKAALQIPAPANWNWFRYLLKVLIDTYTPIVQTTLWIPGHVQSYAIPAGSNSNPNSADKLIVISE